MIITSWEIDGETVETVADFIFGGSKITADGDCSHEIKRRLLLGKKAVTNLDGISNSQFIECRLVRIIVDVSDICLQTIAHIHPFVGE